MAVIIPLWMMTNLKVCLLLYMYCGIFIFFVAYKIIEVLSETGHTPPLTSVPTAPVPPEETVLLSAASHSVVPPCEPGTSASAVNTCTPKVKGKRKRTVEDDDDVIITKITKIHETTVKLFLEHEKSILEKEKEEDRQRRKEDREHEFRMFLMLCSGLGGHGSYPLHQFAPPGPSPPSQQQQHSEEFDSGETYTGLQYQFPPS